MLPTYLRTPTLAVRVRSPLRWNTYLFFNSDSVKFLWKTKQTGLLNFIKTNWICAMTRHHVINILLARNLPFDSDVRQWSHPLMIPLHCLWAKSNNRTLGFFEYDRALFLFNFVHSHARWGCCSTVCLRFQVMPIKQVDCKISTKKTFFKKTIRDIFGQLHRQECKATKTSRQASAQPWPQRIFSLWEEDEKEFFNFLKLLMWKHSG